MTTEQQPTTPTTMQHLIDRVESLKVNVTAFMEANNLQHFSTIAKDLNNLTLAEFVGLCDHYGLEVAISKFPSAWVRNGLYSICLGVKDMVEVKEQPSTFLDQLRKAIPATVPA